MTTFVELDTGDESIAFATPSAPGEVAPVGRATDAVEKLSTSMREVFGLVRSVAGDFRDAVKDSPITAAELEFGLQFTAKGTLYVVETQAQGSIRVKLTITPSPTA